ncbi:hypothetical protein ADUPG1_009779, partial [Aduncisulcus paluster]
SSSTSSSASFPDHNSQLIGKSRISQTRSSYGATRSSSSSTSSTGKISSRQSKVVDSSTPALSNSKPNPGMVMEDGVIVDVVADLFDSQEELRILRQEVEKTIHINQFLRDKIVVFDEVNKSVSTSAYPTAHTFTHNPLHSIIVSTSQDVEVGEQDKGRKFVVRVKHSTDELPEKIVHYNFNNITQETFVPQFVKNMDKLSSIMISQDGSLGISREQSDDQSSPSSLDMRDEAFTHISTELRNVESIIHKLVEQANIVSAENSKLGLRKLPVNVPMEGSPVASTSSIGRGTKKSSSTMGPNSKKLDSRKDKPTGSKSSSNAAVVKSSPKKTLSRNLERMSTPLHSFLTSSVSLSSSLPLLGTVLNSTVKEYMNKDSLTQRMLAEVRKAECAGVDSSPSASLPRRYGMSSEHLIPSLESVISSISVLWALFWRVVCIEDVYRRRLSLCKEYIFRLCEATSETSALYVSAAGDAEHAAQCELDEIRSVYRDREGEMMRENTMLKMKLDVLESQLKEVKEDLSASLQNETRVRGIITTSENKKALAYKRRVDTLRNSQSRYKVREDLWRQLVEAQREYVRLTEELAQATVRAKEVEGQGKELEDHTMSRVTSLVSKRERVDAEATKLVQQLSQLFEGEKKRTTTGKESPEDKESKEDSETQEAVMAATNALKEELKNVESHNSSLSDKVGIQRDELCDMRIELEKEKTKCIHLNMRVEEEEKRRKDEIDNLGKVLVEARVELEGVRSENEKLAADLAAALQHIDILKDSEAPWSHRDKGSPKHDQRRLPSKQRKFRDRDTIEHDRRSASSSYIEGDTISGGRSHTPEELKNVESHNSSLSDKVGIQRDELCDMRIELEKEKTKCIHLNMRVEEEEKRRKDEIDNLGKVLVEARVELEGVRSENEKLAADLAAALQHIDILKDSEAPWSHRDKGSPKHDQRRLPSKQRKFRDRDTIEHDRRSASSSYIEGDTISGGRSHTPALS